MSCLISCRLYLVSLTPHMQTWQQCALRHTACVCFFLPHSYSTPYHHQSVLVVVFRVVAVRRLRFPWRDAHLPVWSRSTLPCLRYACFSLCCGASLFAAVSFSLNGFALTPWVGEQALAVVWHRGVAVYPHRLSNSALVTALSRMRSG